jgi:hypothetical protein
MSIIARLRGAQHMKGAWPTGTRVNAYGDRVYRRPKGDPDFVQRKLRVEEMSPSDRALYAGMTYVLGATWGGIIASVAVLVWEAVR